MDPREFRKFGTVDNGTLQIIAIKGKEYKPAPLAEDIEDGPTGLCFDWCALQAAKSRRFQNGKYRYVEGMATDPDTGAWILHAWLTDGEHAFDPTWPVIDSKGQVVRNVAPPCRYIGIELDIRAVHKFMKKTGYQGVLANRWRWPDFARTVIFGIEPKMQGVHADLVIIDDMTDVTPAALERAAAMMKGAKA